MGFQKIEQRPIDDSILHQMQINKPPWNIHGVIVNLIKFPELYQMKFYPISNTLIATNADGTILMTDEQKKYYKALFRVLRFQLRKQLPEWELIDGS